MSTSTARVARLLPDAPVADLAAYEAAGGHLGLAAARHLGPDATIDAIADAGLRGRGGAGFPTATKWRSVRDGGPGTRYVVCNAAEGEPGTFKDRALLRTNPYAVLEGVLIAAHVLEAPIAYVALKASAAAEHDALRRALGELADAGWVDEVELRVATGPEEYLFGEEKALLEVLEGNEPLPRQLPPYLHGLFATAPQLGWQAHDPVRPGASGAVNPTLVNNAETFAHVAWILANGADAFRSVGTVRSPGTVLCTVIGDVERPGVVEVAMGTPLGAVIEACGGVGPGRSVKAVFPGVANPVLGADALATPLSYEGLAAAGSGLGAGGFIVYDDTACMVEVMTTLSRFLAVESCGQCPPCKLGTNEITAALDRIRTGRGRPSDLGRIEERLRTVTDGNRCYLPVQARDVVASVLRAFPDDVAAHLEGWCPSTRTAIATPKVLDLVDGRVVLDERQDRKRPDWTVGP